MTDVHTCRRGHPMLGVRGDGRRYCLECTRRRNKVRPSRQKERFAETRELLDAIVEPRLKVDALTVPHLRIGELIAHSTRRGIFRECPHIFAAEGRWLDLARAFIACTRCAPDFARSSETLPGCSLCGREDREVGWASTLGGLQSLIAMRVCRNCHLTGKYCLVPAPENGDADPEPTDIPIAAAVG